MNKAQRRAIWSRVKPNLTARHPISLIVLPKLHPLPLPLSSLLTAPFLCYPPISLKSLSRTPVHPFVVRASRGLYFFHADTLSWLCLVCNRQTINPQLVSLATRLNGIPKWFRPSLSATRSIICRHTARCGIMHNAVCLCRRRAIARLPIWRQDCVQSREKDREIQ